MKRLAAVIAAIMVFAVGAGCKDNTPQTGNSQAKLIEPCDLISKTEAEQFLGEPMKAAEKRENKAVGDKLCLYNAAGEDSFGMFQITVSQQAFMPNNGQTPKSIYETLKANFPNAVKVDGVGDDAFIAPPGLHILKDNYYITIAVGNSDKPKNREILKAAGKKAVENLEKLAHEH